MSDVYVPGVKSRFNSEKLIEDLMKVERIPKERAEKTIENLETQKGYWQELGRRMNSLRDSSRFLFSFQNPFNDRIAFSADDSVITAQTTREAVEQDYRFTVKQVAQADRFLSPPLDEKMKIEAGTYVFSVGQDEISLSFRGGDLREFTAALNRRGKDKIGASLISVEPGSKSLLIESKITGGGNRLGFSGEAAALALRLGLAEQASGSSRSIVLDGGAVRRNTALAGQRQNVSVAEGVVSAPALSSASINFNLPVAAGSPLALKFETATAVRGEDAELFQPPPGPAIPSPGAASYGGIVIEGEPSKAPQADVKTEPPPQRVDTLSVFSLSFTDGTKAFLPPITDTINFAARQIPLAEIAAGKTIASLNIENANTHREISLRGVSVFDPTAIDSGLRPLHPVSTAQDAVITMEGIEMRRPSNSIDDIIPGATLNVRGVSDRPVRLEVRPDRESVKNALISMVGNYNRLMAEVNVLTRSDERLVDELTYLDADEAAAMKKRLGVLSGDSTLNQFKTSLLRTVTAPYPTEMERDLALLSQIGISTNSRSSGGAGYDPARLRGYLEIDEKALDAAIESKFSAIKQLLGNDTDGDLLVDTGIAYNLDALAKPYVETGGIITLKTGTIDSRISQDKRRIDSMDRQLAAREADLKLQYGRMEGAFARMEQMSASLENFSQRNNNNNR